MKARIIVDSTIAAQGVRLQELRDALIRIRDWNSHPREYGLEHQREYYRDLAREALDQKRRSRGKKA